VVGGGGKHAAHSLCRRRCWRLGRCYRGDGAFGVCDGAGCVRERPGPAWSPPFPPSACATNMRGSGMRVVRAPSFAVACAGSSWRRPCSWIVWLVAAWSPLLTLFKRHSVCVRVCRAPRHEQSPGVAPSQPLVLNQHFTTSHAISSPQLHITRHRGKMLGPSLLGAGGMALRSIACVLGSTPVVSGALVVSRRAACPHVGGVASQPSAIPRAPLPPNLGPAGALPRHHSRNQRPPVLGLPKHVEGRRRHQLGGCCCAAYVRQRPVSVPAVYQRRARVCGCCAAPAATWAGSRACWTCCQLPHRACVPARALSSCAVVHVRATGQPGREARGQCYAALVLQLRGVLT
jgi:hypothetical protein